MVFADMQCVRVLLCTSTTAYLIQTLPIQCGLAVELVVNLTMSCDVVTARSAFEHPDHESTRHKACWCTEYKSS